MMKIIHSLVVSPGQCGLYETAKDMMTAEERLGCTPIALEPSGHSLGMTDDAIAVATDEHRNELLATADVIVDHSGCDASMLESGVPIIHIRHGRPLSTFLTSHNGSAPNVFSHLTKIGQDKRYAAIVTLWAQHIEQWQPIVGRQVHYIPAPVDLERFTPDGPKRNYDPAWKHYVCADMWRADECPFGVINDFRRMGSASKLHIYGVRQTSEAMRTLFESLGAKRGEVGWAESMPHIYRGCDRLLTCAGIATRAVREALACGCKVVGWCNKNGNNPRQYAERNFDSMKTARELLRLIDKVAGVPV